MIYFVVYLFLEVIVSVNISSSIGGLMTFIEIILSAFLGISILVNFRKTFVENITAVSYNSINLEEFQRLNLFTLIGALLLIIPGFLTDILGFLMQFSVLTSMFVNRYSVKFGKRDTSYGRYENKIKKDSEDVIDVEIINNDSTSK